jgi:hypothetical protein
MTEQQTSAPVAVQDATALAPAPSEGADDFAPDPLARELESQLQRKCGLSLAEREGFIMSCRRKNDAALQRELSQHSDRIETLSVAVELKTDSERQRAEAELWGEMWKSETVRGILDARGRGDEVQLGPSAKPPAQPSTWAHMAESTSAIQWDWPGWLPRSLLTILAANSGDGKSALALRICQSFITGCAWPNGDPFQGETGAVLWCEAEAAQAVNLERARAWNLPLDQLLTPFPNPLQDACLDDHRHRDAIRQASMDDRVRLIVVDSLRAAHTQDESSSRLIGVLKWLAELARDAERPVLLVHHLRKRGLLDDPETVSLDRLRGSSAIVQTARVIWSIDAPDPANKQRKRLSVIKSNLGLFPDPIGFTLNEGGEVSFGAAPEPPRRTSREQQAADLLLALLAKGPMKAVDIQEQMEQAGFSWRTAKRAKELLGVLSLKVSGSWVWSLPASNE